MSFLKSFIIIVCLNCNFKHIDAHQGFRYLKKVTMNKDEISVRTATIDIELYYNPVDEEWSRKKCTSLGFTYQDPNMTRVFSSTMIPVDRRPFDDIMYISLSKVICHNRLLYNDLMINNIKHLKTNPVIEELFETKEQFDLYIKDTKIDEEPVIPNDYDIEQCPVCYQDSTLFLHPCNHQICERCAEIYFDVLKQNNCPLCRTNVEGFIRKRGNAKCINNYVELLAAAFYIDVCIYLYRTKKDVWYLFHKNWPNYDDLDLKNEKCIYLFETDSGIGIVTYVT